MNSWFPIFNAFYIDGAPVVAAIVPESVPMSVPIEESPAEGAIVMPWPAFASTVGSMVPLPIIVSLMVSPMVSPILGAIVPVCPAKPLRDAASAAPKTPSKQSK